MAVVGQLRKDHGRLPLPYCEAVSAAGGRPRVVMTFNVLPDEPPPRGLEIRGGLDPDDASALDGADALVLPGGGDIDPRWYGCEPHPATTRVSHRRDRFEATLLRRALRTGMPVLGICHGMQLINVCLGGTLDQHLPDTPGRADHDAGLPRAEPVHGLRLAPGSRLAGILGTTGARVNSHHHQGVARLGEGLVPVAWAEDGVLEAVESDSHPWLFGVQWHPEAMPGDPVQARLFEALVDAAAAFAARRVARPA